MEEPAAESRFRVLPIAEQEKLKEDEEFSLRGHFEEWLRPVWSIYGKRPAIRHACTSAVQLSRLLQTNSRFWGVSDDIFQSPNIYGANLKNLE